MRVVCVDEWHPLVLGAAYTIAASYDAGTVELREHLGRTFRPFRFIPADPAPALPAMTEELLAALAAFYKAWGHGERRSVAFKSLRDLADAIERAGILPPPPPRTTGREATISEWWFV